MPRYYDRTFPSWESPFTRRERQSPGFYTTGQAGQEIKLTEQRIGARAYISLHRLLYAFRSNDPQQLSNMRKATMSATRNRVGHAIGKAITMWVDVHGYDPEALQAAEIKITFEKSIDGQQIGGEPALEAYVEIKRRETPLW